MKTTPFYKQLDDNNGFAVYNLLVSIRDCKLYAKGIKPHRHWRIGDVKKYFGIKGNAEQLAEQLTEIRDKWFKKNLEEL